MTYHSSSTWEFEQEVTDEVVEGVVSGLKYNREYNGGKYYTPDAYTTFNAVDSLIYQIGKFLDAHEEQGPITEEAINRFLQKAPESGKVVTKQVLAKLQK